MRRFRSFLAANVLLGLVLLAGCWSHTVRPANEPNLVEAWRNSVSRHGQLSSRTSQTLRRLDLAAPYEANPAECIGQLHILALKDPQPDYLFALAEMNYLQGRQAERGRCQDAVCHYYLCAGYAYHYLFATADALDPVPPSAGGPQPTWAPHNVFDPRFRLACDLYNTGLAKCIAAAQRAGRLDARKQLRLPTPDGNSFTLSVVPQGFTKKQEEFGPLLFCEGREVPDLANQYRSYGLGVPLIATRQPTTPEDSSDLYLQGASFPVTAFFRFDGSLSDLVQCRVGQLELYNPLAVQTVQVLGKRVPLETDLTTPLAYFLSHTDLDKVAYTGFLRPDTIQQREGIYMLEPYQPGKIPVLMVHGLLSSPTTWLPLFNDLRADPVLRERYQFWFYFYPTSNPYIVTAADLRDNLHRLRARVDSQHQDRAFDQMVLVGHSMGGLISHLLTIDSGDDFWKLVSTQPLDRLKLRQESELELRRVFYFQREPWVKRVVFLGTPHHGSKLSPALPGLLADYLVRLPKAFVTVTQDLVAQNKDVLVDNRLRTFPTSVDLLAPGAPALELLAARAPAEAVHYHSIVGVAPPSQDRLERWLAGYSGEPGDGVVPYRSAHLDNVDSEQIVCADHFNVHRHPLAVLEVRRILLSHLRAVDDPPTGIQQVTAPAGPAVPAQGGHTE